MPAPHSQDPWSPGEAVSYCWQRVKADPGMVLGPLVVGMLIGNVASGMGELLDSPDTTLKLVSASLKLINVPISTFMTCGMTLFCLNVLTGRPFEFGDIFKGGPYFLHVLVGNLLIGLGAGIGGLLLVVPGVILALGWSMSIPAIVDRNLGPIEGMKESWRLTYGQKWDLLVFFLLCFCVALLGLLVCCVGMLVAVPLIQMATVYVYLRLSNQYIAPMY